MDFLGKIADETVTLFDTNILCEDSPEDTVKVYGPSGGSPYKKANVYIPISVLPRTNLYTYIPWWFTKIQGQAFHASQLFVYIIYINKLQTVN